MLFYQHYLTRNLTYVLESGDLHRLSTHKHLLGGGKSTRKISKTIKKSHCWIPLGSGKEDS